MEKKYEKDTYNEKLDNACFGGIIDVEYNFLFG